MISIEESVWRSVRKHVWSCFSPFWHIPKSDAIDGSLLSLSIKKREFALKCCQYKPFSFWHLLSSYLYIILQVKELQGENRRSLLLQAQIKGSTSGSGFKLSEQCLREVSEGCRLWMCPGSSNSTHWPGSTARTEAITWGLRQMAVCVVGGRKMILTVRKMSCIYFKK